MLHGSQLLFIGTTWGYRTPKEAAEKKKLWICARVEKISDRAVLQAYLQQRAGDHSQRRMVRVVAT